MLHSIKVRRSFLVHVRRSARARQMAVACSIAVLLHLPVVRGADQTWSGNVFDGFWANSLNWLGNASPGSTSGTTNPDVATFNAPIANTWGNSASNPIGLDFGRNVQGINFDLASGNYFIGSTSGNALQLTSGGTIQILNTLTATNAVHTINAPLVIQGGAYTLANNSASGTGAGAGTLNFGGGITGGAGGAAVLTLSGSNTNANTISSVIGDGSATPLALSKTGAGTWALSAANTYSGGTTVSHGILQVAGGGSIGGNVTVGNSSGDNGALNVTGGSVSSGTGTLGFSAGSSGTATVSSGGWNNSTLYVGRSGTGTLNVTGGSVFSSLGFVGANAGSSGTVTVSAGSWSSNNDLVIGDFGTGVLNLTGGSVTTFDSILGTYAGSSGTATVSGGTWTHNNISGTLYVGGSGSGALNVTGGSVSNATGFLGYNPGSNGTATVSSGSWHNATSLYVGYGGNGALNVTGGSVFGFTNSIGFNANVSGTATVSGGTWNNVFLTVGRSGSGTLNITDAGVVSVSGTGTVTLAQNSGSHGTLNMGTGGVAGMLSGVNTVTSGSGTAVVNFNHTGNYTFTPNITGAVTVNKLGAGTTVLTGAKSYTGATTVSAGTLFVNGSISSSVTVSNAGSTLGGIGTVGNVSVGAGAILEGGEGSPTGALTSGGTVSLLDGSKIELTLGPSATHSSLVRTGGTWSFDTDQAFTFNFAPEATESTFYDNIITGLSGSEAGLASIASWTISTPGVTGSFSYDGAGNVDLTIATIPEPGTAALLLACLPLLGLRRRRRGPVGHEVSDGGFSAPDC